MEELFRKYLNNEITRGEFDNLLEGLNDEQNRRKLAIFIRRVAADADGRGRGDAEKLERLLQGLDDRVLGKVRELVAAEYLQKTRKKHRYIKIPIAAAVAILMAGLGWYMLGSRSDIPVDAVSHLSDIGPGKNRAVLTLEGHGKFQLDSAQKGVQVTGDGVRYQGGQLIAAVNSGRSNTDETVQYAVLTTPKGGQYQVTLPDGTNVWLNAASSLRYPMRFDSDSREVELEGEGYFEVVPDKRHRFIVHSKAHKVTVLGTRFNVNAYGNERRITTTVVEGSVEVSGGETAPRRVLEVGQQAVVAEGQVAVNLVNVNYYTGWVSGRFTFNHEKLPVVLRQIERWYDVEFVNMEDVGEVSLWGTLSRGVMLSELLNTLELNTGVKFKREGRRIVMSQ